LERRTRIWFEANDYGLSIVNVVADLISPYLGWKAPQKRASIKEYQEMVKRAKNSVANLRK
jgi:glycerol-3-phosphate dehydrogenase